jgi:hypothetical protein
MLYELVGGARPFLGGARSLMKAHIYEPAPGLGAGSEAVRALIDRMMRKEPEERTATMQAAVAEMRSFLGWKEELVVRAAAAEAAPIGSGEMGGTSPGKHTRQPRQEDTQAGAASRGDRPSTLLARPSEAGGKPAMIGEAADGTLRRTSDGTASRSVDELFAEFLDFVEDSNEVAPFHPAPTSDRDRRGAVPPRGLIYSGLPMDPRELPESQDAAGDGDRRPSRAPEEEEKLKRPSLDPEKATVVELLSHLREEIRAGGSPETAAAEIKTPRAAPPPPPEEETSRTAESLGRVFDEFASDAGMWEGLRPQLDRPMFAAAINSEAAPIEPGASLSARQWMDALADIEGATGVGASGGGIDGVPGAADPNEDRSDVEAEATRHRRIHSTIAREALPVKIHLPKGPDAMPTSAPAPEVSAPAEPRERLDLLDRLEALAARIGVSPSEVLAAIERELDGGSAPQDAGENG